MLVWVRARFSFSLTELSVGVTVRERTWACVMGRLILGGASRRSSASRLEHRSHQWRSIRRWSLPGVHHRRTPIVACFCMVAVATLITILQNRPVHILRRKESCPRTMALRLLPPWGVIGFPSIGMRYLPGDSDRDLLLRCGATHCCAALRFFPS